MSKWMSFYIHDGSTYGYAYSDGSGYGYGDGYGYTDDSGSGYGFGGVRYSYSNGGYGSGYAYENNYGSGGYYGSGCGSGYGEGDTDGSGSGYGFGYQFKIPYAKAWTAYHCIKKTGQGEFLMINGKTVKINQKIYEKEIRMCEYGLHACLSPRDASSYNFNEKEYVLTKVKVWGDIIVGVNKLVATNRMIIEEIK